MTDTELKLEDAATQLDLAAASSDRDAVVRSCLNGMIEMGRSVTLIMQKESGGSEELTEWYKARMAALAGVAGRSASQILQQSSRL